MSNRSSFITTLAVAIEISSGISAAMPRSSPTPTALLSRNSPLEKKIRMELSASGRKQKKNEKLEEKVKAKKEAEADTDHFVVESGKSVALPITTHKPAISYTIEEEHLLAQQMYGSSTLDYGQLQYGPAKKAPLKFGLDDDYWVTTPSADDTDAEAIETHEASGKMQDIQYAFITGSVHDVSAVDRRKFDMWIKFNKALFHMYELLNGVTREIDYARHL